MSKLSNSCNLNFLFYYSSDEAIGIIGGIIVTIQCVVLIISTEKALKKF